MSALQTMTEDLALQMLARDGVAVIWRLNLAAAEAHRTGHPRIRGDAYRIGRCG